MPLRSASTPPGGRQFQRISKSKPKKCQPQQPALSRNYDDELRRYLATTSQQVPDVRNVSAGIISGYASLPTIPFSKDFGSFDLTLSQTEDGRCVVLVKYEGRVFINGVQIYIQPDGQVCDIHGKRDTGLQKTYESALKTRRRIRSDKSNTRNHHPDTTAVEHQPLSHHGSYYQSEYGDTIAEADLNEQSEACQTDVSSEILDTRVPVEAELHDLEHSVGHIITQLYKIVLHVFEHEASDDTESAFSEGDDDEHSSDQRQLLLGFLRRFADQFNSVVEVSANMQEQVTGQQQEGEAQRDGDNNSAGLATSVNSTTTFSAGSAVSSVPDSARQFNRSSYEEPAWIHDSKSLKNEKVRLHAELAATRSELRRLQRRHEDVKVLFEGQKSSKAELQDELVKYEEMNKSLKQRLAKFERSDFHKGAETERSNSTHEEVAPDDVESHVGKGSGGGQWLPQKARNIRESADDNDPKERYQTKNYVTLRSEMKRLRHVTDDMEEEMERMSEETISLRMRGLKIERDRKELREKLRLAEALNEDTRAEVTCLDKKCAELETKCQNLEREKAAGQVENERTSGMLADVRSRYRTLEREIGELTKVTKLLEVEKRQLRTELDRLEQSKLENGKKLTRLTKDNGDMQVEVSQLRRDKSSVENEVVMIREESAVNSTGRKQAEETARLAESELRELHRAYAELTEQNGRLADTAATADSCCKILKEQNEVLLEKTQDMEANNETLETRTRELSNAGRLLEVENSEMKHMLRSWRSENAEMKTKLSALTKENADFRAKYDEWGRDYASAGDKMRNLVRAKGDLQTIFHQLASLGTDAASRFEKMDNDCATLEELHRRKVHLVNSDDSAVDASDVGSLTIALRD